jgi:hypothetical protein
VELYRIPLYLPENVQCRSLCRGANVEENAAKNIDGPLLDVVQVEHRVNDQSTDVVQHVAADDDEHDDDKGFEQLGVVLLVVQRAWKREEGSENELKLGFSKCFQDFHTFSSFFTSSRAFPYLLELFHVFSRFFTSSRATFSQDFSRLLELFTFYRAFPPFLELFLTRFSYFLKLFTFS